MSKIKKTTSLLLAIIMLASICLCPGILPVVSAETPADVPAESGMAAESEASTPDEWSQETEAPGVTDVATSHPEETTPMSPPEPEVTAPAESEAQIETAPIEFVDAAETETVTETMETEQSEAAADANEQEETADLRSVSDGQIPVMATRTQFHAVKRLFKAETTSASDTTAYLPNASYMMKLSSGGTIRFGNFHTHEIKYNGKWVPAYCLDMGLASQANDLDGSIDNYTEWSQYIDNTTEGNNKKKAITLVLAYSKKLLGSRTYTDWDYAAIQTVIWEIMSGRRQSTWPYMTTGVDMYGQNYDNTTSYPGTDHISFNDSSYPRARRPKPADFFFFSNGSNAYQYARFYTYSSSSTQIANATAFNNGRQLYTDIVKALTMHTIPSFAYTSSSDAAAASHVKNLQWDGSKYTITLTDTQGVIAHYIGKPCPSTWTANGVTYSLSTSDGNMTQQLTISATDFNAVNGITLSWQRDTLAFNSTDGALVFKPDNANMQPTVFFDHDVPNLQTAYIKLAAPGPVTLKKTTQGSASVLDAIQDNPLYSLQGAVYEIHQGSATGPVVETLTTNANGEATGTQRYAIGTTLYAVEKTAPSGYLLNTTPVKLTVSAGSNVFNVSDSPVFDPNMMRITKTGVASERIAGAVFKVEFYAWTWAKTERLLRTWYFQSDANGYIVFNDAHIAGGYQSDPLYKPDGSNPTLPLGCIVIKEVETADGYVLPTGNDGKVFLFVKQNEEDRSAYSYWGDGGANPLTTANPYGVYKIENDADPKLLTAVNSEAYGAPFSLQKIDPSDSPLEGAVFQVDYFDAASFDQTKLERTWYFKTDSNGFFTLEDQYLADGYTSDALFPTNAIPVGIMRVREIAAPEGFQLANITGIWRMKQTASGSSTVGSYWAADNGDTPTTSYGNAAYILDAELDKLYVKDTPLPGTMTMLKSLPAGVDGSKGGYAFRLYRFKDAAAGVSSATYYGRSDDDGRIYRTNSSFEEPAGEKVYTFEGLTDGKYAFREVLSMMETQDFRTQCVRITTSGGITPAVDLSFQGSDLSWDDNGDCTISNIQITGLNGGGTLTIEITNAPTAEGSIRVRKVNEKGQPMAGVAFLLEYSLDDGDNWNPIECRASGDPAVIGSCTNGDVVDGVLQTGADGWAEFPGLVVNTQLYNIRYRLTEVKTLAGYELLSSPVFDGCLTFDQPEIERTAVNHPTFQMPMTGSDGFAGAGIGLGLCLLASVLLLLFLPKKREDMNNG